MAVSACQAVQRGALTPPPVLDVNGHDVIVAEASSYKSTAPPPYTRDRAISISQHSINKGGRCIYPQCAASSTHNSHNKRAKHANITSNRPPAQRKTETSELTIAINLVIQSGHTRSKRRSYPAGDIACERAKCERRTIAINGHGASPTLTVTLSARPK